jgi:hypothetical protein
MTANRRTGAEFKDALPPIKTAKDAQARIHRRASGP